MRLNGAFLTAFSTGYTINTENAYYLLLLSTHHELLPYISLAFPHLLFRKIPVKKTDVQTSLVAQWLRICLPMLGTRVQSLVREDPTCHGATKPVRHNY